MQPDPALSAAYFETPVRAERKLLLQHLLRNASGMIYLRAPAGAGKTLFAERLIGEIGDDRASVWIRAELDRDIAAATVKQLDLSGDAATAWPERALSEIGDRDLLLVVDNADRLAEPAVSQIASLHAAACPVLLLGEGGLPVASPAWDVQFVDLPPFSPEQSAAFVRSQVGGAPGRINDDLATLLHETAQGWPGPLISALREVMAKSGGGQGATTTESVQGKRPIWPWLAGGAAAVLLGVALFYQDAINALFESPSTVDQRPSITPAPLPFPEPQRAPVPPADSTPLVSDAPATGVREAAQKAAESDLPLSRRPGRMPTIALPELSTTPAGEGPQGDQGPQTAPKPPDPRDREAPSAVAESTVEQPVSTEMPLAPEPETSPAPGLAGAAIPPPAASPPMASPEAELQPKSKITPAPEIEPPGETDARSAAPLPQAESAEGTDGAPVVAPAAPVSVQQGEAGGQRESLPPRTVVTLPHTGPAPVEERDAPATRSAKPPRNAPVAAPQKTDSGIAWLKSRAPNRYTLQLVGARDRAAIERFVRKNRVKQPFAIFERTLNGRPWFSLVAGDYRDRDAAIAARDRLPKPLPKADSWPRTFASIQENL